MTSKRSHFFYKFCSKYCKIVSSASFASILFITHPELFSLTLSAGAPISKQATGNPYS